MMETGRVQNEHSPAFRCAANFLAIIVLSVSLQSGCTVLPKAPTGLPSHAFTDTGSTTLGKMATAHCADVKLSSVFVLNRGEEALVSRLALIDLAERSIDVQTYCWYSDRVGRLIAQHLMQAADRGVRVRLLVDDIYSGGRDFSIAMFGAHPNIELRLYNPFRFRFAGGWLEPLELLFSMDRLDHRMHNKTFVVDNQAAVIGGRNIADEYFGVNPRLDYRDFDLLAFGHAASQVSECFDAYWADNRSYPVHDVAPHDFKPKELQASRLRLDKWIAAQKTNFPYRLLNSPNDAKHYLSSALASAAIAATDVLFDDPRKGNIQAKQPSHIREVLAKSPPTRELIMVNPYFLPQEKLVTALSSVEQKGVQVRVLTNSLASTDVVAVHAAYSKLRKPLLTDGISLSELRPDAAARKELIAPNCAQATLAIHAKVMVLDRDRVFVGSMNLDPRSHRLNTEDGILVHSPKLARQVADKIAVEFEAINCWQLSLQNQHLTWTTSRGGKRETSTHDPDASFWRKLDCGFLKLLPIENEL